MAIVARCKTSETRCTCNYNRPCCCTIPNKYYWILLKWLRNHHHRRDLSKRDLLKCIKKPYVLRIIIMGRPLYVVGYGSLTCKYAETTNEYLIAIEKRFWARYVFFHCCQRDDICRQVFLNGLEKLLGILTFFFE